MNLQFFSIPTISEFFILNHDFGVFPNYKLILNAVSFCTFVEVFLETFGVSRIDVVGHGGTIACRKITFGDQTRGPGFPQYERIIQQEDGNWYRPAGSNDDWLKFED